MPRARARPSRRERDATFDDLGDVLGSDVVARHGQAVPDICLALAEHLVYRADALALPVDDLPAGLDHQPRHRVGHQTVCPSTSHTGPCVASSRVSLSARSATTSPRIASASQRSKQRRAITGATPYPARRAERKRNADRPPTRRGLSWMQSTAPRSMSSEEV